MKNYDKLCYYEYVAKKYDSKTLKNLLEKRKNEKKLSGIIKFKFETVTPLCSYGQSEENKAKRNNLNVATTLKAEIRKTMEFFDPNLAAILFGYVLENENDANSAKQGLITFKLLKIENKKTFDITTLPTSYSPTKKGENTERIYYNVVNSILNEGIDFDKRKTISQKDKIENYISFYKLNEDNDKNKNHKGNVSVRDIYAPDCLFNIELKFKNITASELECLIYSLRLYGRSFRFTKYYHQIGMYKNLGMGTILVLPKDFHVYLEKENKFNSFSSIYDNVDVKEKYIIANAQEKYKFDSKIALRYSYKFHDDFKPTNMYCKE